MMTRTLVTRCAPIAIAASAVLPSIAFAQDGTGAQPVIVLPEVAPAAAANPAPAPTIVLPEPEAVSPPAVAAEARPAETRRAAAVTRQPARTEAAQPAATSATIAAPATVQAQAPQAIAASPSTVPLPQAEPVDTTETVAATAASDENPAGEGMLAGLLGALAIATVGGVALMAARRRRRISDDAQPFDEPAFAPNPVAARSFEPRPAPVFNAPAPTASAFATPVVARGMQRSANRVAGDPIPLPTRMPESFEERDALLRELVAAEPDRANPFTSPRARARRAKLIIQSLGRDFTSRKPRFDLSEYTNRWPALRGWQPATA